MSLVRLAFAAAATAALLALPATAAAPPPASVGITILSTGVVRVKPNAAELFVAVASRALTARAALAQNSARTARVLAALKRSGVRTRDLQTSSFDLSRGTTKRDRRFRVENSVRVIVRGANRVGTIVDAAVAAGANRVSGPQFFVASAARLYDRALDRALRKARAKATRVAVVTGVRLGRVLSIVEAGTFVPGETTSGVTQGFGSPVTILATDQAIEPGQNGIEAAVTVRFAVS